jgi:hypothetical protein
VFHLDVAKDMHVASLCFRCFRRILLMFHLDVSKVNLGVAHVANSYTRMFKSYVLSVPSVFRRMLQMLHILQ